MLLNNYISSLWSYSSTSFFSKTCLMKQYFHNMLIGIKERNKREKYCYSETKFIRFIYFKIYLGIGKTYRNTQCFNVQCFKIMCHAYTRTMLLFCSFARCRYMCWVSTTDILFVKHCRSISSSLAKGIKSKVYASRCWLTCTKQMSEAARGELVMV